MKMATTKFGHKLHLISSRPEGAATICGRDRYRLTKIKTPPAMDTCQVCVRSCVSQLRRIFGDDLPELAVLVGLDRGPV
jgi:hypothetical protein